MQKGGRRIAEQHSGSYALQHRAGRRVGCRRSQRGACGRLRGSEQVSELYASSEASGALQDTYEISRHGARTSALGRAADQLGRDARLARCAQHWVGRREREGDVLGLRRTWLESDSWGARCVVYDGEKWQETSDLDMLPSGVVKPEPPLFI